MYRAICHKGIKVCNRTEHVLVGCSDRHGVGCVTAHHGKARFGKNSIDIQKTGLLCENTEEAIAHEALVTPRR